MENELLPCPCICGHITPCLEELSDDAGGGWRVLCYVCHRGTTNGRHKTKLSAVLAWHDKTDITDTRAADPSVASHETPSMTDKGAEAGEAVCKESLHTQQAEAGGDRVHWKDGWYKLPEWFDPTAQSDRQTNGQVIVEWWESSASGIEPVDLAVAIDAMITAAHRTNKQRDALLREAVAWIKAVREDRGSVTGRNQRLGEDFLDRAAKIGVIHE